MSLRVLDLPVVDGCTLPPEHRSLLRPAEMMRGRDGREHRLPRFFYRIDSTAVALETQLTEHFALWEFIEVDLHEAPLLRTFPKYVPCGVALLAAALELLRMEVGAPLRIAANGGYRSPAHRASLSGSPHCWATAANVYRVGSEYLDSEEKIQRYAALASRALSGCWIRPPGSDVGMADDHLHVDLGFVTAVPRECSEAAVDP